MKLSPTSCIVFLVAISCCLFWQLLSHEIINFDANIYLTENRYVLNGLTADSLIWAATSFDFNWHPLTWVSHMLDVELYGLNPAGHYASSIILHLLNTILLFRILFHSTKESLSAVLVAAIFAVHPLHLEPVAWLAARKDLLSTFFGFLCISEYLKFSITANRSSYIGATIFFACSLMSKGTFVTMPILLILLDFWPLFQINFGQLRTESNTLRKLLIEKIPFVILAVIGSILTGIAQSRIGAVATLEKFPLSYRVESSLLSYCEYLQSFFFPTNLSIFYPFRESISSIEVAISAITILLISVLAIKNVRRAPEILFGWAWYLVVLLPMIGLVQLGEHAKADRYTYVPYVGLSIALVYGTTKLINLSLRSYANTGIAIFVLSLTRISYIQIDSWRNSESIYRSSLAVTTNNHVINNNLGLELLKRKDFSGAIEQFIKVREIDPRNTKVLKNIGDTYLEQGDLSKALEAYTLLSESDPGNVQALNNIGVVLIKKQDYREAQHVLEEALKIKPNYISALGNLGMTMEKLGDSSAAVNAYSRLLMSAPKNKFAAARLADLQNTKDR